MLIWFSNKPQKGYLINTNNNTNPLIMNYTKHISTLEQMINDFESNNHSCPQLKQIENLKELKNDLEKLEKSGIHFMDYCKPFKKLRVDPLKGTISEVDEKTGESITKKESL